ncbi:MAG: assimilatory sulfite reductase (NADPH) flavoprotein subunit [Aeromonas sp.]|jgi:sulfite reductase (NADPH) flavoprotein alpha-component|uniref:assimilatory sulfite reductase (NADPH) flavoprotein subunit n=1 Tax=Aeromonas TaxID=642 RepID=UPI0013A6E75D|nr:assimilatory sulfite reductase (NADPH) flavoprotein subunit [Aeromonas media]MBP6071543.1 assimilatory sulfite reductase (NADPH) flavoprotein subunit [Aeromonas sp.]MBP6166389.1 assimilatory sulfite reductase (NADPH) flavoprotein subunit [Aeromonas sp.]MBP8112631.1 assimilatory sulfite reductase (NADPH) flavoprotein subunit [Aeromonas sp.]MBP8152445.1 assimilatory sulfite reductase (NADPH) flavoprotein subunit [Aeromonas sp.]MBP8188883.1 assimilatory sulfite reductase (NADPH) flavoprotein s
MQLTAPIPNISPLSDEQQRQLNQVLSTLNTQQLAWVSGYLYGLSQSGVQSVATSAAVAAPGGSLTILYGSQTGNAKGVASAIQAQAKAHGLPVTLTSMADYKPKQLKKESHLLVVVSTYGEGEPPESAVDLFEQLKKGKIGKLEGLKFAVLGLGDSSYEFFCQTGKDFDDFLSKAGAERIHELASLDVDYQEAASAWGEQAVNAVASTLSAGAATASVAGSVQQAVGHSQYHKENPFPARLSVNQKITGRDSTKDIRHIEINLEESGITYQPGDALGIWFDNDADLVGEVLALTGLSGDEATAQGPLRAALTRHFELTRLHGGFITGLADISGNAALKDLAGDKAQVNALVASAQVVDVLKRFPATLTAEQLVKLLRPLTPRLYSIASAQSEVEEEVHLTVGVVRYPQEDGTVRSGGASSYLADRLAEDAEVRVFVEHNDNFRLPANPDTPVIMVGPGTGIAPFRAFMQEREAQGAEGKNWLFFGNPHFTQDFLYQVEWQRYVKSGLLSKISLAFSRDQANKIYVQDRLREAGLELYQWLEAGAHFYVCGDANHMAKDVQEALLDVISDHGHKSREEAEEYLSELRRAKRYQRDVY